MSVLASDAFTNTNGTALSTHNANWTATTAGSGATITTNSVRPGAGYGSYFWNGVTFPNDQYAEGTLVAVALNVFIGVSVRCATGNNFYMYAADTVFSELVKVVADVWTELGSAGGLAVNDVIRIECIGDQLTAMLNGTVETTIGVKTDTSLSSGKAGIYVEGAATTTRLDDWTSGDFPTPFVPIGIGPMLTHLAM